MKLRIRHIVRNVVFNWFGTVVNTAVGFFLAPFILHTLGDIAYGVWVLAVSVVGYLSLLDLGMQGSILRFVSQGYTKQDHKFASEALSAALWVRLQISLVALLLSGALALFFGRMFKVPPDLLHDARIAILVIGATTAVTMSYGIFGGVISALNRYDLQNYVGLTQTFVRVVSIVVVLRTGHGIVAIALCELLSAVISRTVQLILARRIYPELRISFRKPRRETLKKIWSYSSYAFLITVAVQLVYQTDNIIVGAFVSATAVTFYAIANSLCRYVGQIVTSMDSTFVPAASSFEAAGETNSLLNLYKNGTRAMILISLPILLTLIIRGYTFIGLWMGPAYAHRSGIVLIILCVGLFFSYANRTAAAIAFGVERHKIPAFWAMGEGVANLTLSVILARRYGIYGVAVGTMVPSLLVQIGFWPGYVSRMINVSRSQIIFRIWTPMILASIPFAVVSYLVDRTMPAHNLFVFMLQVLLTLPVFFLVVGFVFRRFLQEQILPRVRTKFLAFSR